jgi:hypothetical protein
MPFSPIRRNLLVAAASLAVVSAQAIPAASFAAPVPATIPETAAITEFADQITTLGYTRFPDTFTSATLTDAATVTVYATAEDAALLAAINALPSGGAHVLVQTVPHSYRQLDAVAHQIGADGAALRASGVAVSRVALDAPHGKLVVTLAGTTGALAPATETATVSAARSTLTGRYGTDWVSVADTPAAIASATSRDSDASPWSAGDGIYLTGLGAGCTLGWTTRGNASGNDYLLTAGHCGKGTVSADDNGRTIGNVATQYLGGSHDWDFDTIRANGKGRVWYGGEGSANSYAVRGSVVPSNGSLMTVDGDVNKPQHTGNEVTNNLIYIYVSTEDYGTLYVGPMVQIRTTACIPGDSGGPAYVRVGSTGTVEAVGTIDATGGGYCYVYWLNTELSAANVSLVNG